MCYGQPLPIPDIIPNHPCQPFSGTADDGDQIIVDFVHALRADPLISTLVGGPTKIYAFGIAHTAGPMDRILHSAAGKGLFDFTELVSLWWLNPDAHTLPSTDAGRVLVLQTEADILNLNAAAARGSGPMYRSYEIAGAPGVPSDPHLYAAFPGPPQGTYPPLFGVTSLNWTPTVRALFLAGDRWAVENKEPPASVTLQGDAAAADGLARDQNGNALGGIRYPDLEVGRGAFKAVDFALQIEGLPKGFPLYGAFTDLACMPLTDGSTHFWDHDVYVQRFTAQTNKLVSDGFLLREDADQLIAAAKASNVGNAEACVAGKTTAIPAVDPAAVPMPQTLPETGQHNPAQAVWLLALIGAALTGIGVLARQWAKTRR